MELGILRATGETSNTVMHAGSPAVQKAWVALRLLQRQQSLVRGRVDVIAVVVVFFYGVRLPALVVTSYFIFL